MDAKITTEALIPNVKPKYPGMAPNLTPSELAILSRPSSPVPPKIRPKIKERPTLFCFDRTDFENPPRPFTATTESPKQERSSRPRNRITATKSNKTGTENTDSVIPVSNAKQIIFKRRSRSLQSPATSVHKLRESFRSTNEDDENVEGSRRQRQQAVFASRDSVKSKDAVTSSENFLGTDTENEVDDFCRMEELVKYLTSDQDKMLEELTRGVDVATEPQPASSAPLNDFSVQTALSESTAYSSATEGMQDRMKLLENVNTFCTTEIETLRQELSTARRIIAEQSERIENLNPRAGPPWVVPSEENAFKPSVDYFSFRTIDEPTQVAKVRVYQPGMALTRELSPEPPIQPPVACRTCSEPPKKTYLDIYRRRIAYAAAAGTANSPLASRARSLPGKALALSTGTPNGSPSTSSDGPGCRNAKKRNAPTVEYLAIALASREGLLREIAHSIKVDPRKKAKKILHFRFNMLLSTANFSIEDLHFLLTSHRRFIRWLNNYIHYSLTLIERFDSKYMKSRQFYVPAILDHANGDVLKGIFIPVPGKDVTDRPKPKQPSRIPRETQTEAQKLRSSFVQCNFQAKNLCVTHQCSSKLREPRFEAAVQAHGPPTSSKGVQTLRETLENSITALPKSSSHRNVVLEQLLKRTAESQESVVEASASSHPEISVRSSSNCKLEVRRSGNKICAANFGDYESATSMLRIEAAQSEENNESDAASSEPFIDCSSKTQNSLLAEVNATVNGLESEESKTMCKGDYYDPLPSGSELTALEAQFFDTPSSPEMQPPELQSPLDLVQSSHKEKAVRFYNHKGNAHLRAVDLADFIRPKASSVTLPEILTERPSLRKLSTVEDYAAFFDKTVENFRRKQADPSNHDLPKFKSAAQVVLDILNDRSESLLLEHSKSSTKMDDPLADRRQLLSDSESEDDTQTRVYRPEICEPSVMHLENLTDSNDCQLETHKQQKAVTSNSNNDHREIYKSGGQGTVAAGKLRDDAAPSVEENSSVTLSSPRSRLPVRVTGPSATPRTTNKTGKGGDTKNYSSRSPSKQPSTSGSFTSKMMVKAREKFKRSLIPVKASNTATKGSTSGSQSRPRRDQVVVPRVHRCNTLGETSQKGENKIINSAAAVVGGTAKVSSSLKRKSLSKILRGKWSQSKAVSNL